MTEFHGGVVVIIGTIDTTHHTLIITEEEDRKTSNTVDGDEKTTLLKLVNHIGPGNNIHGGDCPECLIKGTGCWFKDSKKTGRTDALLGFGEAESGAWSGMGSLPKREMSGLRQGD